MPYEPPLHDYRGIFKTRDFGHCVRFHGLKPTICGPVWISMSFDPWYTTIETSAKLVISAIFCRFRGS